MICGYSGYANLHSLMFNQKEKNAEKFWRSPNECFNFILPISFCLYRTFYSLALLLFISSFSFAQPQITLSKTIGGSGGEAIRDMIATSNGNLVAVCAIDSIDRDSACNYKGGLLDIWLIKMDAAGNIFWQHCYGGSATDDPYQIIETQDGGFLFAATTFSNDSDITFNHGGSDIWLVKTDSLGNIQ